MLSLLVALAGNDETMPAKFSSAVEFWREFHVAHGKDSDEDLATAIGDAQWSHEQVFGGNRHIGKMLMPYTALTALYDEAEGFADNRPNAVRMIKAFFKSMVSIEVKSSAAESIIIFNLDDDENLIGIVRRHLHL